MSEERDVLLERLVRVYDAAHGGNALISCQGQGMDGFSQLAEYDEIARLAKLLMTSDDKLMDNKRGEGS